MKKVNGVFLKLLFSNGKVIIKPLPNQTIKVKGLKGIVEKPVKENYPVTAPKEILDNLQECPINSVLYAENIIEKVTSYYAEEIFFVASDEPNAIIGQSVKYASEEVRAYYIDMRFSIAFVPEQESGKKSFIQKLMDNKNYLVPTVDDCGFFIAPEKWYHLVRNIKAGINTLITGPTGTGKTEIVELLTKRMKKQLYCFDMGTMIDPIASLIGTHRLKNKESVFETSRFIHAIQQEGAVILLDEINQAPPAANNILFPCLDSRRKLFNEYAEELDREIKVADDVVFIATANFGSEYIGTYALNRALIDRFQLIEFSYLTVEQEAEVLVSRTNISLEGATLIAKLCNKIRDMYKNGELGNFISTRHAIQIAELHRDGFDILASFKMAVLPMFEGDANSPGTDKNSIINLLVTF
jgi:ATP-dependent Lon protease